MIEVQDLTRNWGSLVAVDHLTFRVEPGEVLGFLGPNGAGKSTTMKMITGFLAPTAGRAQVCGHDVRHEPLAARRSLGYLPEGAPSYGEMTVSGFLRFVAEVRHLQGTRRREALDRAIAALGLEEVLAQPIDTLSKGFRRRVGIAQAVMHDPPVLILDEPTDGLDPNQKHEVRRLINGLAEDRTVIVSTHILEEVHAMCTRVIVIARGRLLADDTPSRLEARSRYHGAVSVTTPDWRAAAAALAQLPETSGVETDDRAEVVTVFARGTGDLLHRVAAQCRQEGWRVQGLALERGRLDEVFRELTRDGAGVRS